MWKFGKKLLAVLAAGAMAVMPKVSEAFVASALDAVNTVPFTAWLAIRAGGDMKCNSDKDEGTADYDEDSNNISGNEAEITGDGEYSVDVTMVNGSETIECMYLQTNINGYAFIQDGEDPLKDGVKLEITSVTVEHADGTTTEIAYTGPSEDAFSTDNDGVSLRVNLYNVWKSPQVTDITNTPEGGLVGGDTVKVNFTVDGISQPYGDLTYIPSNNGTLEIVDCDKSVTNVEIPSEIDGIAVTSIGSGAFESCTNLTNIIIPDTVTTIGCYAFRDCSNFSNIYYLGTEAEWNDIMIGIDNAWWSTVPVTYNADAAAISDAYAVASAGTVEVTLDELKSNNYQVSVPLYASKDFCILTFGIAFPEDLSYTVAKISYGISTLYCIDQFVWVPMIGVEAISAGEFGTITFQLPEDVTAGTSYAIDLQNVERNKDKKPAVYRDADGNISAPVVFDGEIKVIDTPVETTTTATTTVPPIATTTTTTAATTTTTAPPIATGSTSTATTATTTPSFTKTAATTPADFTISLPADAALTPGNSIQMESSVSASSLIWSTSDKSIAVVDSEGTVALLKPGTVTIMATDGTRIRSVTLEITNSSSETLAIGDLDGDGSITTSDAYNALLGYSKITAGGASGLTAAQEAAADVDGDGKLTTSDAFLILKYYSLHTAGTDITWEELLQG